MQDNSLVAKQEARAPSSGRNRYPAPTLILAVVAVAASAAALYLWRDDRSAVGRATIAQQQGSVAVRNFQAGKETIDTIVSDLADRLAALKGVQPDVTAALLGDVEAAMGTLVAKTDHDAAVLRSQGSMYIQLSETYRALGNNQLAVASARKGSEIFRGLAAAEPNNDDIQSNVGLSLQKLGEALRASGDVKGGLAADRESLEIARALASKEPGNRQFRTDVVLALWRLASAGDEPRARLTEALKILKNLKLAAMLTPDQESWIDTIEDDLSKM
jgi:tetratricopeptide (TPR) repeat protein